MRAGAPRRCRNHRVCRWEWLAVWACLTGPLAVAQDVAPSAAPKLSVFPPVIRLGTPEATEQMVVQLQTAAGRRLDVTRRATVQPLQAGIVDVTPLGRVLPLQDGVTTLQISCDGVSTEVRCEVSGLAQPPPVSFRREVVPILSKAGCNSGGCHGKAEGQQGFKLSVFGFDAEADYQALIMEGRGRRVFLPAPEKSLLLLKGTARLPHGGGQKIVPGSRWEQLLRRWIHEGAPDDGPSLVNESDTPPSVPAEQQITGIVVEPATLTLAPQESFQLRVSLQTAAGPGRCVTGEADFQSNHETLASVDHHGLVTVANIPGEAAILVRYMGHVAVCRVTQPREDGEFTRPPERNFIDRLVWDKLVHLRVPPSPGVDDATFLRRASLDTIGTLPTGDEVRKFLNDPRPDKRQRLVAELLERPEYADYWGQQWSDLLQVDKDIINPQAAVAMSRWIRDQMARNVPFNQFAAAVLTAEGSTYDESPAAFFQVQGDAEKAARAVSQLFLGVRIECAQCHHHPFERWDQPDYYALAGFFTGVQRKPHPLGGLKIASMAGTDLKHPRTAAVVPAAALGAPPAEFAAGLDRRRVFAAWATSAQNPYFARTIANRMWAHYFGRGLVEPIDDLRDTNPASNEPLLQALAAHLVELKFDLKAFTRTLLDSHVYQLSTEVNPANALDEQNHSHAFWKPLPAEVLLDAVSQATGVPEQFNGWPVGYRAIQIWDNKLPSHFLEVFGRPRRQTVCACERGVEPSMAQALHLMNSAETTAKLQHRAGRVARLAESEFRREQIVEELYLQTLSRMPTADEQQLMQQAFEATSSRRDAIEDILWTLLNTREFVFNH